MEVLTDASVLVKWFKKGEEKEAQALILKDAVFAGKITVVVNEYVLLEIIRALKKAGYPQGKIIDTKKFLDDLENLGFIKVIKVCDVRNLAMELIYVLNLYASDALVLATALIEKINLITEDKHLLKKKVIEYASKKGIKVLTLDYVDTIIRHS